MSTLPAMMSIKNADIQAPLPLPVLLGRTGLVKGGNVEKPLVAHMWMAGMSSEQLDGGLRSQKESHVEQCAKVLCGSVIHSLSLTRLEVLSDAVLGVDRRGKVLFLEGDHTEHLGPTLTLRVTGEVIDISDAAIVLLPKRGFLVPGFCDVHTHAPQFKFAGLGYDMQLLQWLETYTFPNEAQWKDAAQAKRVASNAVRRTLANGTTSACWFATIHTDAALLLADIAHAHGQRAFVGKVNMDRNSPAFYVESTAESLSETERFVEVMLKKPDSTPVPRPMPVITPRFVPTCTADLMTGLAAIAAKHNLLIQSHVSENQGEIAWVKDLHPHEPNYTSVYDSMACSPPRPSWRMASTSERTNENCSHQDKQSSLTARCRICSYALGCVMCAN
jgi:guanine deaminase